MCWSHEPALKEKRDAARKAGVLAQRDNGLRRYVDRRRTEKLFAELGGDIFVKPPARCSHCGGSGVEPPPD